MQLHGALVEVSGLGVVILGPSGVGKSETALELIVRGHRLVADDIVELSLESGELRGRAAPAIRHFLEIRGIGICYVPELYGPGAVLDESRVDLICRLEFWREGAEYERVGLERATEPLLGVALPSVLLAVRPSASMATLVELAARDLLARRRGLSGAERLDRQLRQGSA